MLGEPSNDIDIETLETLEELILSWDKIVIYISHDETLIERTANKIIHIEQIRRKTKSRFFAGLLWAIPFRRTNCPVAR